MPAAPARRLETARHLCHADNVLAAVGVSTVRLSLCTFRGEVGDTVMKETLTVTGDICCDVISVGAVVFAS